MCGINGIINSNVTVNLLSPLEEMNKNLIYRGPDADGFFIHKNIGLAHRRLSIIDLDKRSDQPFKIDDYVIIYNGEIYNFKEIRADLISKGVYFSTESDTEVLLKSYIHYGDKFIHALNGMFAFAILDIKRSELKLYRDRLGEKPLYYYSDNSKFIFSSSIKSILTQTKEFNVNEQKIYDYFQYRFVPGEDTLIQNIKRVRSGCSISVNTSTLEISHFKYWDILNIQKNNYTQSKFNTLFKDACRLRLVSDVNIGAYLSSGVDSSSIAATVANETKAIDTYTIDMNCSVSEASQAGDIAKILNLKNRSYKINRDDFIYYKEAVSFLEEPIGDSILAPTYLLNKLAKNNSKVVLSGEGADEILSGYVHHYLLTTEYRYLRYFPKFLFKLLCKILSFIPLNLIERYFPYPAKLGKSGVNKLVQHFKNIDFSIESYNSLVQLFYGDFEKYFPKKYKEIRESEIESFFLDNKGNKKLEFHKLVRACDLKFWNTDYTLLRLDKLSMAHSIEARVPFLDYRLVELMLNSSPFENTQLNMQKKTIRNYLKSNTNLPAQDQKRKKKAFFLPIQDVFDKKLFNDWAYTILSNPETKCFYNKENVFLLLNKERELIEEKQLFTFIIFELWHQDLRKFVSSL